MNEPAQPFGLRDAQLQNALDREGLVTLPLLAAPGVAELAATYHALVPQPRLGFTATLLHADPAVRRAAHRAVHAALGPALAEVLVGLRLVNCGFSVRSGASVAADLPLHQDWTFVDERRVRSYGVWLPLIDVDPDSGCLELVPGSHASAHPLRAPGDAFGYPALLPLLRRHLRAVPMRAGQVALFDQRLFHRSAANGGARARVAAAGVLIPQGEPLQRCMVSPGGARTLVPVADDHYLGEPPQLS